MVPAYMLSLLGRQQLMLKERFLQRYPHPWLVWEPGDWRPPAAAEIDGGKTQLPNAHDELRPRGSDALCFELFVRAKAVTCLKLGRGVECDVVINDMTVSREHLLLYFDEKWAVENIAPEGTVSLLRTSPLPPKARVALPPDAQLTVGGVHLSLYDSKAFFERVAVQAASSAATPFPVAPPKGKVK